MSSPEQPTTTPGQAPRVPGQSLSELPDMRVAPVADMSLVFEPPRERMTLEASVKLLLEHDDQQQQQERQELQGFPQFSRLPPEIQLKIFTESISKPNIHIIKPTRCETEGKWCLKFRPQDKRKDTSGYRWVKELSLVNRMANAAVRLALGEGRDKENCRDQQTWLPFPSMKAKIDGAADLVFIDLPNRNLLNLGYFHPEHQVLNPSRSIFDADAMAAKFANIEKVALRYSDYQEFCHFHWSSFRCATAIVGGINLHHGHRMWKMCPEELCGLLNCFPKLREFYFIFETPRTLLSRENHDCYVKNYFTLPTTSPLRRRLAVFHSSTSRYIELVPELCYRLARDRNSLEYFTFSNQTEAYSLLEELRLVCFRCGLGRVEEVYLNPLEQKRYEKEVFRMSRRDRNRLVCKVLIDTGGRTEGWEGEEARRFRALMGV